MNYSTLIAVPEVVPVVPVVPVDPGIVPVTPERAPNVLTIELKRLAIGVLVPL